MNRKIIFRFAPMLALAGFIASLQGQEVSIPDPGLDAAVRQALQIPSGPLTEQDLLGLTNLEACCRNIASLSGLEAAHNLSLLDLDDNQLTDGSFPGVLTNLTSLSHLDLSENPLTDLVLPGGLTNLNLLRVENSGLTNLTLPAGLTRFTELRLGFNQLPGLVLPADMTNLSVLSLFQNHLTKLTLPPNLPNLSQLDLSGNHLSSLTLPAGLTKLSILIADANQLTSFTVSADMTNLSILRLNNNQLTNLTLPSGLNHLSVLLLAGNELGNLRLPAGMTNLTLLDLTANQLTRLTLPPDMTRLNGLILSGNPLTTLVLSEPLATILSNTVATLQNQGVSVFTYPLTIQLLRPRPLTGAFQFGITGPPGVYAVLGSTNLLNWTQVGVTSNELGAISFVDTNSHLFSQRFYRGLKAPENMVFIPPNTFTMGSPTNEQDRDPNEGPQTVVTLTRGFWIGKFEVTQGEYLSVLNTNPSFFPDLTRPVETVSWPEATNYCAKLTERELAAGHIPPGSRYRLPTEAEWECAARAGTTTRFSYGDDPDYSSLTNYAWLAQSGFTTHPVGQKLPNPWGLYDMAGNVWEWTLDWLGDLPGGEVTDPTGPPSNPIGWKVVRGGSYDFSGTDCRSARRFFFGNHPALNDSDLGFRVVLVIEPQ